MEEEKGVNKILSMKKDLPDLKKIVQVISRPKCMFLESPKIVDIYLKNKEPLVGSLLIKAILPSCVKIAAR